jgi:serine/threonine protein kinase
LQRKEFSEAVDVYSFGVLCWEMMTGLEPWGHVTDPKEIVS